MKRNKALIVEKALYAVLAVVFVSMIGVSPAWSHCDTMSGPVISEARAALESGDVTPLLKWVQPEDEAEMKAAFAQVVKVRTKDREARALADKYFLETLIRLHRAGEGAPYTGLKDIPPEEIVSLADDALASGSAEKLIGKMQADLATAIRERFDIARQTGKSKNKSVEYGRKFVESYVQYMHYVEGVQAAIAAESAHNGETAEHRD
jgi:hypothetical protein